MNRSHQRKEIVDRNKLQKRLRREVGRAIEDYRMIEHGDHVMVCISGGKDSYTLLDILLKLQAKAPVAFKITAVHLDQKQPNHPQQVISDYLSQLQVPFHVVERDTYGIVKQIIPEGKTMCGLCSRLRRGILYSFAEDYGITKIALGHHRDDMIETLFLNMFHGGQLKAMPPKLKSDNGRHIVIRPLAYCREDDISEYANHQQFPIIPCNLCGSQDHLQRQAIKSMLREWGKRYPGRLENIFRSLSHVAPSQLADRKLFDFEGLDDRQPKKPSWARSGGNSESRECSGMEMTK